MCLGVPGRVIDVQLHAEGGDLPTAVVDFGGVRRSVCVLHVPDVKAGEYVMVHVGFALARIDEAEAARIFAMLRELDALDAYSTDAAEDP
jgi:hydrogenase expression/formation protein HypC